MSFNSSKQMSSDNSEDHKFSFLNKDGAKPTITHAGLFAEELDINFIIPIAPMDC